MQSKTCGAEQARAHLPELLDAAHRGSSTVITKRGRPYAALVPVDRATAPHSGPSLLQMKNTGAGLWGRSSARTLARLRDEWR
ncbi:MAG TPA: type II toxin-antitoxin system prevent-host-death family antitoxin [Polyangia bacterium]